MATSDAVEFTEAEARMLEAEVSAAVCALDLAAMHLRHAGLEDAARAATNSAHRLAAPARSILRNHVRVLDIRASHNL